MKKYLVNPTKTDALLLALMFCAAGIILCMFTGSLLATIIRIFGIVLIVYGAYELYMYFGVHRSANAAPMMLGIPAVLFGIFLALWPRALINFFPIIAGVIVVFNSVMQIQRSMVLRSAGAGSWMVTLIMAIIMLVVGIFLIFRPGSMINMLLRVTGIALIFEGIVIAVDTFTGSHYAHVIQH